MMGIIPFMEKETDFSARVMKLKEAKVLVFLPF